MNFFVIGIFSVILISQKFFLINEEFLILICFISFLLISYEKIGNDFFEFFTLNSKKIENLLFNSFIQFSLKIKENWNWNLKLILIFKYFNFLKNYYLTINQKISSNIYIIQNFKKNYIFFKKLYFIKNVEEQFLKLILVLVLNKINDIILLNKFYLKNCNINKFNKINKINFKEYLSLL